MFKTKSSKDYVLKKFQLSPTKSPDMMALRCYILVACLVVETPFMFMLIIISLYSRSHDIPTKCLLITLVPWFNRTILSPIKCYKMHTSYHHFSDEATFWSDFCGTFQGSAPLGMECNSSSCRKLSLNSPFRQRSQQFWDVLLVFDGEGGPFMVDVTC